MSQRRRRKREKDAQTERRDERGRKGETTQEHLGSHIPFKGTQMTEAASTRPLLPEALLFPRRAADWRIKFLKIFF